MKNKVRPLKFNKSVSRFVVGSVNAYHTGRMLFSGQAAWFADEGNFSEQLKIYRPLIKNRTIKEAVIVSASGEKDAIWEIKAAKRAGLKTTLLTCTADSTGARLADRCLVSLKSPEPYSYNFSTYLGLLLGLTGENPAVIKRWLKTIRLPKDFRRYDYFTFILPDCYRPIVDMINVKDDELFGPYSSLRAYSEGNARHAKFICQSPRELVITFGRNEFFGPVKQRWDIKVPATADYGAVLSASYYIVGLIQAIKPPHFKKGITEYCLKSGPRPYGRKQPFPIIVK
ncbi:MAG: hypothetical protein WC453_00235 [Patescibacteria group bacterium]